MIYNVAAFIAIVVAVSGKIYFKENFNDASWIDRWTVPTDLNPTSELGEWKHTAGEYAGIPSDKGIQTGDDARFYALSAKLNEAFTNKDKELVIQMSVKHEQDVNCGVIYIKLLGDMDQSKFGDYTPYQIMFGPSKCGPDYKKTQVTFNYPPQNNYLPIKSEIDAAFDRLTHLYTLVVKPDNTFEVLIDLESVKSGSLADNWDFLLPKEINVPSVTKPADWVDPEDNDPEEIPNSAAVKSENGEDEEELHVRCTDCTHVGLAFHPGRACTLIDDIIVTDSFEEAMAYAAETFLIKQGPERSNYERFRFSRPAFVMGAVRASALTTTDAMPQDLAHIAVATLRPTQMDAATQDILAQIKRPQSTVDIVKIPAINPLTNHTIEWKAVADGGAEQSVMDDKTAALLRLQPAHDCTAYGVIGWWSVVALDLLGTRVNMAVCVSRVGYNVVGKAFMEENSLCHCPQRGIVVCSPSVVVFGE